MSIFKTFLSRLHLVSANPIRAVLFDLDGTLIDSETTACLVLQNFFSKNGFPLDKEEASFLTGRKWETALEYLLMRHPLPFSLVEIHQALIKEYRRALEDDLRIIPGAVEAIRSLSTRFPLGLVSGSARWDILWALDKMNVRNCFQVVLGSGGLRSKQATT